MLLVPKQLRRAGMTGVVPYFGGRFTPAQAYAASHPTHRPGPPRPAATSTQPPAPAAAVPTDARVALANLRDAGVITPEEYADLCTRVPE